jgi:tetratricopeptide (TPR) repeat protein
MKHIFKLIIPLLLLISSINSLAAQDSRLANRYFQSGEYEKAAVLYSKLYDKNPNQDVFFSRYIESLVALEDFQNAEKAIQSEIKRKPQDVQLYVSLGNMYERKFEPEKADKQYRKAIQNLPPNTSIINKLGNAFLRLTKYDLALETYKKGSKLLDNNTIFSYNLADLYRRKSDDASMIREYINYVSTQPTRLPSITATLQRNLKQESAYTELKRQLYERISTEPENLVYPELLQWAFVQEKDYNKAFRQARAIDRKLDEPGNRVIKLADIAYNDKDYNTAIKAYEYIIDSKGDNSRYYIDAKKKLLISKRKKITENPNFATTELDTLKSEYKSFIDEFGINNRTGQLVKDFADFLAIYGNDSQGAIDVLQELIEIRSISKYLRANSKISLADYYLMQEEIWEASLLYSQVDKAFREEYIGEVARFRNAKLFYYSGNFEWAQAQFDILKASTSKLISNDAIDLSVFITDNLGLDSTETALQLFSQADLLAVQNQYKGAFDKLDSIEIFFPDHPLQDEVLYRKAQLYKGQKDYTNAIVSYNEIIEKHPDEITCDNSIFELAEIYEKILDDKEKAKTLYEKLFIDYSNSTFAVEARKRFRILRGDEIQ